MIKTTKRSCLVQRIEKSFMVLLIPVFNSVYELKSFDCFEKERYYHLFMSGSTLNCLENYIFFSFRYFFILETEYLTG